MKLTKGSAGPAKIAIDMTPMIDCVFQLIIFFMLTLKIRADEGDFNINMPIGMSAERDSVMPDIKVRLESNSDGSLRSIALGRRVLGNDDRAFAQLNHEIRGIIGKPGSAFTREVEVEIDADFELHYQFVVNAISACTGAVDPKSKQVIRYVEKVKFAPPRSPRSQ
ncbi:MAG: ExbD/TolR family protein [Planctomycetales bacterium]